MTDGTVSDEVFDKLREGRQHRQKPVRRDALGLVRFIFPDSYNVYMRISTPAPDYSPAPATISVTAVPRAESARARGLGILRNDPNWYRQNRRSNERR